MCKYLVYRSRKGKKYAYCRLNKTEECICEGCKNKEYKRYEKSKTKLHKRTKATNIQKGIKKIVWMRDSGKCIFCDRDVPLFNANAHFIPRSQGGLGIEENIFTACEKCHAEQDNGLNTKEYEEKAEAHLKSKYKDWSKEKLIFKKY